MSARWKAEDVLGQVQHADEGRCPVVADDGQQCYRHEHEASPNDHDFAGVSANPVDGGQHWSVWIRTVHAVREILLDSVREDGVTRYGQFDDVATDDAQKLVEIAEAVGLQVTQRGGFPYEIVEPQPKEDEDVRGVPGSDERSGERRGGRAAGPGVVSEDARPGMAGGSDRHGISGRDDEPPAGLLGGVPTPR